MKKKEKPTENVAIDTTRKIKKKLVGKECKDIGKIKTANHRKILDLTGNRFGKLVVKKLYSTDKGFFWLCQCDCGNEKFLQTGQLKQSAKTCGCSMNQCLNGQKFNKLTVIKETKRNKHNQRIFECQCECGNKINVGMFSLKNGKIASCGCLHKPNLIGKKFGYLTVLKQLQTIKNERMWRCKCDCGKEITVSSYKLKSKTKYSCGCQLKKRRYLKNQKRIKKTPYQQTAKKSLYNSYITSAKWANREFLLTSDEFFYLVGLDCFYCGSKPQTIKGDKEKCNGVLLYNGIDRIDNNVGYIKTNCLTSCFKCNCAKRQLSQKEFFNKVKQIYLNLNLSLEIDEIIKKTNKIKEFIYNPMLDSSSPSFCKNAIKFGNAAKNRLFYNYKKRAKKKNIKFSLTKKKFLDITSSNCYYCNVEPKQRIKDGYAKFNGNYIHNGIDRIDSKEGYTKNNSVPCCSDCNRAKLDQTEIEFLIFIKKIVEHLNLL